MPTISEIEGLAKSYADARADLSLDVMEFNEAVNQIKKTAIPKIKASVALAKAAEHALTEAVKDSRPAFDKPKTQVIHGIKFGFQKAKGKLSWADAANVIRLIRKHFPAKADVLIALKESPAKEALEQLSAEDLKKIGVEVSDAGDKVFIKPVDGQVEKLVDALLKETPDEGAT